MKKNQLLILAALMFVNIACSNKNDKQTDGQAVQADSLMAGKPQRMQPSTAEQTVQLKGKDYHLFVQRLPCDSLPKVKDENNGVFVDNQITLRITRGKGEKVFAKTFTKRHFASFLEEEFLSKSILEGIVFDKIDKEDLLFASSVSYPQTDFYVPFNIRISSDGQLSIAKQEDIEENYTEEEKQ
ncbi:MAG: DUF4738 domain-containing protein [Bacteroidaceae bacterium]